LFISVFRFWGIFWVDASSTENVQPPFSKIARVGKVEPNQHAAKHWLSSLAYPWLLIIDNADNPKMSIEDYFPEGENGLILVTTRDPSNKVHGTIGPRFYHFDRLDDDAAIDILLKAASEPQP
jgi:hypothetical protein